MPLTTRRVHSPEGVTTYRWELLNFRGPALLEDGSTRPYPSYHFWDLWMSEQQLLGDAKPEVDPSVFKDKLVFVGVTAAGLYDVFETPFSGGNSGFKMPGIMVHATITDDILSNRFITPGSTTARLATVVAAAIAIGLVSTLIPAWWATGVTVIFLVVLSWIAQRLFAGGYWLNLSQPALASTLSTRWCAEGDCNSNPTWRNRAHRAQLTLRSALGHAARPAGRAGSRLVHRSGGVTVERAGGCLFGY